MFPVASWDVCPVCVGDDGVELCYCCVYVGNCNGVEYEKLLFCLLHELWPVCYFVVYVCVIRCGVGVRLVRVVIMILIKVFLIYEGSVRTVRHVLFCSSFGEQKVMSGEDVW